MNATAKQVMAEVWNQVAKTVYDQMIDKVENKIMEQCGVDYEDIRFQTAYPIKRITNPIRNQIRWQVRISVST